MEQVGVRCEFILPYTLFCRTLNAEIKPILAKLNEDGEFDVRYFADEAKQSMFEF